MPTPSALIQTLDVGKSLLYLRPWFSPCSSNSLLSPHIADFSQRFHFFLLHQLDSINSPNPFFQSIFFQPIYPSTSIFNPSLTSSSSNLPNDKSIDRHQLLDRYLRRSEPILPDAGLYPADAAVIEDSSIASSKSCARLPQTSTLSLIRCF